MPANVKREVAILTSEAVVADSVQGSFASDACELSGDASGELRCCGHARISAHGAREFREKMKKSEGQRKKGQRTWCERWRRVEKRACEKEGWFSQGMYKLA